MKERTKEQKAMHVSRVTVAVNLLLAAGKLAAGIGAHSEAMVSDAVHSASDVLSTFVVMAGVRIAGKAPDEEHPYGHERLECVAALLLSVMLAAAGIGIGISGIRRLAEAGAPVRQIPGRAALICAALSVAVKEWMYHYTRKTAREVGSGAMMADAWHHRSDALSSVGSFTGIVGARMGWSKADTIAGVVISFFIVWAAFRIFVDAVGKMTDRACEKELVDEMRSLALAQRGVKGIDEIKTRRFGERAYVDMEIRVDGEVTLSDAHETAQRVHDAIEKNLPGVKHCMVHVNPLNAENGNGAAGE